MRSASPGAISFSKNISIVRCDRHHASSPRFTLASYCCHLGSAGLRHDSSSISKLDAVFSIIPAHYGRECDVRRYAASFHFPNFDASAQLSSYCAVRGTSCSGWDRGAANFHSRCHCWRRIYDEEDDQWFHCHTSDWHFQDRRSWLLKFLFNLRSKLFFEFKLEVNN